MAVVTWSGALKHKLHVGLPQQSSNMAWNLKYYYYYFTYTTGRHPYAQQMFDIRPLGATQKAITMFLPRLSFFDVEPSAP